MPQWRAANVPYMLHTSVVWSSNLGLAKYDTFSLFPFRGTLLSTLGHLPPETFGPLIFFFFFWNRLCMKKSEHKKFIGALLSPEPVSVGNFSGVLLVASKRTASPRWDSGTLVHLSCLVPMEFLHTIFRKGLGTGKASKKYSCISVDLDPVANRLQHCQS